MSKRTEANNQITTNYLADMYVVHSEYLFKLELVVRDASSVNEIRDRLDLLTEERFAKIAEINSKTDRQIRELSSKKFDDDVVFEGDEN